MSIEALIIRCAKAKQQVIIYIDTCDLIKRFLRLIISGSSCTYCDICFDNSTVLRKPNEAVTYDQNSYNQRRPVKRCDSKLIMQNNVCRYFCNNTVKVCS